jgi:hypothetical protein
MQQTVMTQLIFNVTITAGVLHSRKCFMYVLALECLICVRALTVIVTINTEKPAVWFVNWNKCLARYKHQVYYVAVGSKLGDIR